TLVTAPEIIFFWVARMIMAGMEYQKQIPFREVYFTGIVRDKQGRKMSKQLGNSPDLLEMIEEEGADAVRFGIMIASPAGNDLMWDKAGNEQGRFFINKMWNALKLVKMWEGRQAAGSNTQETSFAVTWFENRLNEAKLELDGMFKEFRLSEALKNIYSLIWDDFCSWYLEWVKPGFEQPIDKAVYEKTVSFFEELMQLLHPYMPFITEEIYHELRERTAGDDITIKQLSAATAVNRQTIEAAGLLKEVITALRDVRVKNNIKPKETVQLFVETSHQQLYAQFESILVKQANASSLSYRSGGAGTLSTVVQKDKLYIATETAIDTSAQKEQLQKDLEYQKGFLASVEKKLSNERFVQNAKPEVVELEQKKKADAEAKIRAIEESLAAL
ncbi:MAG: class I tRNA ligase family protein, partial [Chitinophagaceae bacterium]|nr:class I tRNA ligase family protein [Chitinophagaceae bacterium]